MRHISIEPPAFFHRGPAPITRLAFFGLISIALLFVDTRYHYLEGIRRAVAIALYPLQRTAQLPGEVLGGIGTYFASLQSLTDENAAEVTHRLNAFIEALTPLVELSADGPEAWPAPVDPDKV